MSAVHVPRLLCFRLPDGSVWPTSITHKTRALDIIKLLSSLWSLPTASVSIWDGENELIPEAKILLCVNPQTNADPGLCVHVRATDAPRPAVRPDRSVDLTAIDARDQERILERIVDAQVNQNLRQAQVLNPRRRLSRAVRCLICRVHGRTLRMIVDTGASLSLLYINQVQCISASYLIDRREPCRVTLAGVGDAVTRTVGVIHSLEVQVGPVSTFGAFAVLDCPGVHGLLGIDWLTQAHATIRVADDTIEIGGFYVPLEDPS